jgi:uncharacterized protein YlxP (DUF503 family)
VVIGLLQIELHFFSNSLKEKRMLVRRYNDRVKQKYNVAVAETAFQDKWQRSELSLTTVATDQDHCHKTLDEVLRFTESINDWQVVRQHLDYY